MAEEPIPDLFGDPPKKRKTITKPVQRSKAEMEKNGWTVYITEKWIPPRGEMKFGVRKDVWGFGDLLMCRPPMAGLPGSIALVQCCSAASGGVAGMEGHRAKILECPEYYIWRKAGGRVFLQGWRKRGARGQVKRWEMVEEELTEEF